MGRRRGRLAIVAGALVVLVWSVPATLKSQDASVALTGTVSSPREGPMEGVVVNARRDGANFTVSVVSGAQGRYRFPRTHLMPGRYVTTMRAVGYDLVAPATVNVTREETATLDLTLQQTEDLAAQVTSLEVAMSLPGPEEDVDRFVHQRLSCAYCHTYNRIIKSRHEADRWVGVINRMASYYPDGAASSDDGRGSWHLWGLDVLVSRPKWGLGIGNDAPDFLPRGIDKTELGRFLATINMSSGRTELPYELETLPRPTGKSTRVIVTQYDMPRKGSVPHEMELDSKGTPWYTDESAPFIGTLDSDTGAFTEYPMPAVDGQTVLSTRDLVFDADDNPWFPLRLGDGPDRLARFDVQTKQLTTVPDYASSQFLDVGPGGRSIWSVQGAGFSKVNTNTLQVEGRFGWTEAPNRPDDACCSYQGVVDSKGNPYMAANGYVIEVDAATGAVSFHPIPTTLSLPRRGRMDDDDRYWFAQYTGDGIGVFDTRTKEVREWRVRKYSTPYTVSVPDRHGYVYAPSNMSERVIRLDPRSGEIVEYLMPTQFDSKKVAIHPRTDRTVVWMANTRAARLVRIEPLESE